MPVLRSLPVAWCISDSRIWISMDMNLTTISSSFCFGLFVVPIVATAVISLSTCLDNE